MTTSQEAMFENAADFLAAHGPAVIALGSLCIAAAVFWVGWGYRPYMSTWLATFARVGGQLLAVTALALQATLGGWLTGVDQSLMTWLVAHRSPPIEQLALAVGAAVGPVELAVLTTAGAVAVGMKSRSALGGLVVLVTVGVASMLCRLVTVLVARDRPPLAVQETMERGYSFPAGNVTGTAALVGILAVAVGLAASRTVNVVLALGAVLAVSAVAASQVYLGMHWLTDVIAGVLLATAVVTVGAATLGVLVDRPARTTGERAALRSARRRCGERDESGNQVVASPRSP